MRTFRPGGASWSASGASGSDAMVPRRFLAGWVAALWLALAGVVSAADLRFRKEADGGFSFDTGALRGRLRAGGKSMGLQEVVEVATGRRLDRGYGWLGHYRVFANGARLGPGAWYWASEAVLGADGSVACRWPGGEGRPLELRATYRWAGATVIEMETRVRAIADISRLEVFVASYFDEAFTEAAVASGGGWVRAGRERGEWQMFPRDARAAEWIGDGRWRLPPDPVAWVVREPFSRPMAIRGSPSLCREVVLAVSAGDCFALSCPHETEAHGSLYASLFGGELRAGEEGVVRCRLELRVRHGVLGRE